MLNALSTQTASFSRSLSLGGFGYSDPCRGPKAPEALKSPKSLSPRGLRSPEALEPLSCDRAKASRSRNLDPGMKKAAPVEVAVSALFPKLLRKWGVFWDLGFRAL